MEEKYKCGTCPLGETCHLHRIGVEYQCGVHKGMKQETQVRRIVSDTYFKSDDATLTDEGSDTQPDMTEKS